MAAALLGLIGGLGYLVYGTAEGAGDWLVLAGICLFVFLLGVAFFDRSYPRATRKRSFHRGEGSEW